MPEKRPITVLLIEDSLEFVELVQCWLAAADGLFVLNWTDSLSGGLERLEKGGITIILLDLGLPDSSGYETFARIQQASAGVPVILLSGVDSEPLALRMIQEGAQDYLMKTSCSSEALYRAIRYAMVRAESSKRSPAGNSSKVSEVIPVMGCKGGVGATSIACCLAMELRRQTGEPTVLMDLEPDTGLVSFLMNVDAKYSVLDAVNHLHHMDSTMWDSLVAKTESDLHIAVSPGPLGADEIDSEQLHQLLTFIRSNYRWVVLDLGRICKRAMSLLEPEDDLYLVSSTSILSMFEVKRSVASLGERGFNPDRLKLIVNNIGGNSRFSGKQLSRMFEISVFAELPLAVDEFRDGTGSFRLPPESSQFGKQIGDMARLVAGIPAPEPRSGLAWLASLSQRLRRAPLRLHTPTEG